MRQLVEAFIADCWEDHGTTPTQLWFPEHLWAQVARGYGFAAEHWIHVARPTDGPSTILCNAEVAARVLANDRWTPTTPFILPQPTTLHPRATHPRPRGSFCSDCYIRGQDGCRAHRRS